MGSINSPVLGNTFAKFQALAASVGRGSANIDVRIAYAFLLQGLISIQIIHILIFNPIAGSRRVKFYYSRITGRGELLVFGKHDKHHSDQFFLVFVHGQHHRQGGKYFASENNSVSCYLWRLFR